MTLILPYRIDKISHSTLDLNHYKLEVNITNKEINEYIERKTHLLAYIGLIRDLVSIREESKIK